MACSGLLVCLCLRVRDICRELVLTMHVRVVWAGKGQLGAAGQMGEAAPAWKGVRVFFRAGTRDVQQRLLNVLGSSALIYRGR